MRPCLSPDLYKARSGLGPDQEQRPVLRDIGQRGHQRGERLLGGCQERLGPRSRPRAVQRLPRPDQADTGPEATKRQLRLLVLLFLEQCR